MENFNKIYSENYKMILNFINRKVQTIEIAEELTNDVFMRVHKHLARFDEDKSSMKTWIMNITSNIVIDYYRKKRLETSSIDSEIANSDMNGVNPYFNLIKDNKTPQNLMESNEMLSNVQTSITSLGRYARIANLYFNLEYSYEEIGLRLKLPLGTVKGQLHRARKMLQENLTLA